MLLFCLHLCTWLGELSSASSFRKIELRIIGQATGLLRSSQLFSSRANPQVLHESGLVTRGASGSPETPPARCSRYTSGLRFQSCWCKTRRRSCGAALRKTQFPDSVRGSFLHSFYMQPGPALPFAVLLGMPETRVRGGPRKNCQATSIR